LNNYGVLLINVWNVFLGRQPWAFVWEVGKESTMWKLWNGVGLY